MMKTVPRHSIPPLKTRSSSVDLDGYAYSQGDCDCDCACDSNEFTQQDEAARLWSRGTASHTIALRSIAKTDVRGEAHSSHTDTGNTTGRAESTLSAWLHITDRCNLACAYCYLPHNRLDMTVEVGRAVINAVFRSALIHNYPRVKLKYAGGEPLIRFDTVIALHQYALQKARETSTSVSGVVLSNGTLLSSKHLATMQELNLRLMISMDGLGHIHDKQRFYTNGKGTYEDVKRGIELALDSGFTPVISVTVTGRNASSIADLVRWLLDHDLPFSLNFYRENDLSQSLSDLRIEEQQMIEGLLAAYKVIEENLPQYSLLACLADRANLAQQHLYTCNVGHDYMVFDHRGRVSKCQMSLSEVVTDVHTYDPLWSIRTTQSGLQNPSVEEKEDCRDCEWKYWCTGGCPLLTYRATGRYDVKSPNCNIYRAIYPEVVRLERLRLLKLKQSV